LVCPKSPAAPARPTPPRYFFFFDSIISVFGLAPQSFPRPFYNVTRPPRPKNSTALVNLGVRRYHGQDGLARISMALAKGALRSPGSNWSSDRWPALRPHQRHSIKTLPNDRRLSKASARSSGRDDASRGHYGPLYQEFESAYRDLAANQGTLIPFLLEGVGGNAWGSSCQVRDGPLHPNAEGAPK